jgi:Methyltransferase domain
VTLRTPRAPATTTADAGRSGSPAVPAEPLGAVRIPRPGGLGKARGFVSAFPDIWNGVVLDVGCRGRELEQALKGHQVDYIGLDVGDRADLVADLDEGLPLPDGEVDVVVALDVLEHVEGIHEAFGELCRVARKHVLIALPNGLVLDWRLRYLHGRVAGKYGLPEEPPSDRHRWFFSFDDARRFCRHRAEVCGWQVADEAVLVGPRRRRIEGLVRTWPNLLSPSLITHLVPSD